jgi:hypothetical protein
MQTFLPYPSFVDSLKALDYRRLNAQRKEARQILTALEEGGAWQYHPAVQMWIGFEPSLRLYANCAIKEWIRRGFENNMAINFNFERKIQITTTSRIDHLEIQATAMYGRCRKSNRFLPCDHVLVVTQTNESWLCLRASRTCSVRSLSAKVASSSTAPPESSPKGTIS